MNPCCAMIVDTPRRKGTLMRAFNTYGTWFDIRSVSQHSKQQFNGGRNINIFTMPCMVSIMPYQKLGQ